MNKIVYLIYEVEKRELLSRLFLGHKIVRDIPEAEIVIIQHSELFKIALFRRPGIVILKSCPIQYLRILKIMKLRGFQIILSQEEGIHYGCPFSFGLPVELLNSKKTQSVIKNDHQQM